MPRTHLDDQRRPITVPDAIRSDNAYTDALHQRQGRTPYLFQARETRFPP